MERLKYNWFQSKENWICSTVLLLSEQLVRYIHAFILSLMCVDWRVSYLQQNTAVAMHQEDIIQIRVKVPGVLNCRNNINLVPYWQNYRWYYVLRSTLIPSDISLFTSEVLLQCIFELRTLMLHNFVLMEIWDIKYFKHKMQSNKLSWK
jgi:hypothetical protein